MLPVPVDGSCQLGDLVPAKGVTTLSFHTMHVTRGRCTAGAHVAKLSHYTLGPWLVLTLCDSS